MADLGFPSYWANRFTKGVRWMPRITISGYSGFGDSQSSNKWATHAHSFSGDVSKIRGNHSLKAGFDVRAMRENRFQSGDMVGYFDFGAGWTRGPVDNSPTAPIGQGLASFLLGWPTGGNASQNASFASQSIFRALFVDDTWRLTRKLTLTLGLRWELEGPWTERFNRGIRQYDFTSVNPLQDNAATAYRKNPIPEIPADEFKLMGGLTFLGVGNPRQQINSDLNNFAPRIGLAYQLSPRTVVRSGYGLFYDLRNFTINQTGFSLSTAFVASPDQGLHFIASLSDPFPTGLVDPPGAKLGLMTAVGQGVSFLDPAQAPNPYMQRWSAGVQRELPARVLVDLAYVGNRGTHTGIGQSFNFVPRQYWSTLPVRDQGTINFLSANVANPFQDLLPGTARSGQFMARSDLLVRYPHFSAVNLSNQPIGFTWYHSLQTRVEKRTTKGFSAGFSWTWSKLMQATGRLNPFDDQLEHVIANIDRTHRLSLDWIYELPFGRGRHYGRDIHSVLQQFLGGWRVAGIYSAQSGIPDTMVDLPLTGPFRATDFVLPEHQRSPDQYYNTSINLNRDPRQAFAWHVRSISTRFSAVRTDGLNVWDISLAKDFTLREGMRLKFEGQFLNAFNHPVFAGPVGNPTNSDFGKISNQLNLPRNVQVALRFVF